jgi:hypothetical protein
VKEKAGEKFEENFAMSEVSGIPAMFRIDRCAILEFYDTKPENSSGHATAINAVAGEDLGAGLMKHYLENVEGAKVTVRINIQDRPEPVTQRTSKGSRLDRWMDVQWPTVLRYFRSKLRTGRLMR